MQKTKKRDPPNTIRCPYIPDHLMHIQSFLTHLTRCKATNKADFKVCPFNSFHIIHKDKFSVHMERCNEGPEDENEWQQRAIQRGFIAGCGGQDPSGFRDQQSSIHSSQSFILLSQNPQNSKQYDEYTILNSRFEEQKKYAKKQKIDYNFKMVTYRRNEPNEKEFNRNFYDLSNLSNYYVKDNNREDYRRNEGVMEEKYYEQPERNKYQISNNYQNGNNYQIRNNYQNGNNFQKGNNYQNEYNFKKKQKQQPCKQAWNQNQRQWGYKEEKNNKPTNRIKNEEQKYPEWKKQPEKRKKKTRPDDDELIFWIDQINKNIQMSQVPCDSGNDEFGNILAHEASMIRRYGEREQAWAETYNFNNNKQNVKYK